MAATQVTSSHALAQTAIRTGLVLEAEERALIWRLVGSDPDSVFVVEESPTEDRGTLTKVRFQARNFAPMPKGRTGYEKGLSGSDNWYEDEFRIAYNSLADRELPNVVSDQNEVEFSIKDSALTGMAMDAATILECSLMHIVAGYSPVNHLTAGGPRGTGYSHGGTDYILSGHNAVIEPHATHHFFASDGSGANTTEALVAADPTSTAKSREVFKIISKMRSKNFVTWPMMPASTPWGKGYVVLGSNEFIDQIKENTSESDIYDLARACIEGGMPPENSALWTNEGFKIRDTFFLETGYSCFGTTGGTAGLTTAGEPLSNVQRAVILGARACHIKFGMGYTDGLHLGYTEDIEHRNWSGQIDTVFGAKKTVVNGSPWGVAVYSHYSEATTATARYS